MARSSGIKCGNPGFEIDSVESEVEGRPHGQAVGVLELPVDVVQADLCVHGDRLRDSELPDGGELFVTAVGPVEAGVGAG